MKVTKTARGFEVIQFRDHNDAPCSLQQSSAAHYVQPGSSFVWLGPDDADPKMLLPGSGWVPVKFMQGTQFTTRAHLDRKQVAALVKHLQCWLETGSFKAPRRKKSAP